MPPPLSPDDLRRIGEALHGDHWQRPLAATIPIAVRTLQRWAAGDYPMPDWVPGALLDATEAALAAEQARLSARRRQMAARPQLAGLTAEIAARVAQLDRLCRALGRPNNTA